MIIVLNGLLMLIPLVVLTAWPHEWQSALIGFLFPAIVLIGLGTVMWACFKSDEGVALTVQEGGIIVLFSWVLACLFSTWPLIIVEGLNFTLAIFESVSGFTTTGLSVVDVDHASHLILLWRSIMQLAGGAGLAIIMIASIAGPDGPGLSTAEGRNEQLVPQVRESAKLVMSMYAGYAVMAAIAFRLAGMETFDAINHAFACISTGGFSTRPESIGHWNSIAIEFVTIPFMILGNLNFLTAYLFLNRKFKAALRSGELRLMGILVSISVSALMLLVSSKIYPSLDESARVAIFEAFSALTTTGFSTTTYNDWNALGFIILISLMLIGGGTCSTAGGIKQYRIYLLFKFLLWDLRRPLLPRTAVVENYIWRGESKDFVNDERFRRVATHIFLYLFTYIVGAGILAAHGYGLRESLFEYASAIGTVGLSIGVTSATAPTMVLWTMIIGMFLGRLEFFIVLISLGKIFCDMKQMTRKTIS
jgi:trk system potassium uptake protein